ncbi:MAG: DUF5996 family protein [Thermomicrobiales bacterium]
MPIATHAARSSLSREERWPHLPLDEWAATRDTLHMWTQVVGKLKVELSPFQNQLWHTALFLTARGLTTQPLPYAGGFLQTDFDFIDHNLVLLTSEGGRKVVPLYPRSVAHFYDETMHCLEALGIDVQIDTTPQEIPDPIPFETDTTHDSYDPHAVNRWWRIQLSSARVMWEHRTWFRGKASPVHWYWGSFDLAATRHNGEPADPPPGGYIFRVAEDEKNWAGGFWTGSGPVNYPAFYAYMYPQPDGLPQASIDPETAFWSAEMREFLLPYDAVRTADDPDAALMSFLQSTYAAGADLAGWDRDRLELKEIPRPR